MSEYINNIISEIQKDELIHSAFLSNHGGRSTGWSFSQNSGKPGFFTPFNKKMDMKQALIATGLLPVLKGGNALLITFLAPVTLFSALLETIVRCQLTPLLEGAGLILFVYPVTTIYFSGAFILNLLKEISALITRSIATLVHACLGASNSSTNTNHTDIDDNQLSATEEMELKLAIEVHEDSSPEFNV